MSTLVLAAEPREERRFSLFFPFFPAAGSAPLLQWRQPRELVHGKNMLSGFESEAILASHFRFRIHTIPSVPIVDCFQKIKQQVKCYLQMAGGMGKQELQEVCNFCKLLNTLLTRQFIIYFEIVGSKLRIPRFLNENKIMSYE